jgi:hypothetical protein
MRFLTNDSWPIIRGVAGSKGIPLLLLNRYSSGVLLVLAIPDNLADLYHLPRGVLTQMRAYLMTDVPLRIDAPAQVSIFAYDNGTFVLESFREAKSTFIVSAAGKGVKLRDLGSGALVEALTEAESAATGHAAARRRYTEPARTAFRVSLEAHSLRAMRLEH